MKIREILILSLRFLVGWSPGLTVKTDLTVAVLVDVFDDVVYVLFADVQLLGQSTEDEAQVLTLNVAQLLFV